MWTLAIPYLYQALDADSVEQVYVVMMENTAEEENVENMNELEKDCKIRWTGPDHSFQLSFNTMGQTSPEAFNTFQFLEIPNPPPKTPGMAG